MIKFLVSNVSRRTWLKAAAGGSVALATGLTACGEGPSHLVASDVSEDDDDDYVTLYDTYAMALYFDGTMGPKTGVISAADVVAGVAVEKEFWHGHGGRQHRYTVTPEQLLGIRGLTKVEIETTPVDSHTHKLFVDMSDSRWRVPGAQPVRVPRVPTPPRPPR